MTDPTSISDDLDTLNDILQYAPAEYDGDEAIDAIAVRYVRDLEAAAETLRAQRVGAPPGEAPDAALGRCQVTLQCHRETGHEGGHEIDPGFPIVAYLVQTDGEDYCFDPADVTIVRRHEATKDAG
jgi:hypothetical protein